MVAAVILEFWRHLPASLRWALASLGLPKYRVAIAAIVLDRDGKVLLCEHTYRSPYPWGLPGGDLKPGEEPARAIEREIAEETGLCVRATRLLLATSAKEQKHVALIYLGECLGGTFRPSAEVVNAAYYAPGALPPLLPTERDTLLTALRLLDEGRRPPDPHCSHGGDHALHPPAHQTHHDGV